MYTAYTLNESSRKVLETHFPPKYSEFVGHHITYKFGVDENAKVPKKAKIKVVGHIDDGEGLEALVVSIDGTKERPDGNLYHITWSLDEGKKPVDSNKLLKKKMYTLILPIEINTTPTLLT